MLGCNISRTFALRSIFASDPYLFLIYSILVLVFTFTFMVRIIEGPIAKIDKDGIDFSVVQNCIWNIIVTMTTVGYGDYYPKTIIGRIVILLAALSGTTLISFMVIALQNYLKFTDNQAKVNFYFEKRLRMKKVRKIFRQKLKLALRSIFILRINMLFRRKYMLMLCRMGM